GGQPRVVLQLPLHRTTLLTQYSDEQALLTKPTERGVRHFFRYQTGWHVPSSQTRPWPRSQAWPQLPQLALSNKTNVSHPLAVLPSQFAKRLGSAHSRKLQVPDRHNVIALGRSHEWPQFPQFSESNWRLASQPSAGIPLQSAKPAAQTRLQNP